MHVSIGEMQSLRELLDAREISMDAAALLGGVDVTTISRICSGQARPTPNTVVRLACALGVNARRMARLCDYAWRERDGYCTNPRAEMLRGIDIDALAEQR